MDPVRPDRLMYRRADDTTAPLHQQVREKTIELDGWFEQFAAQNNLDPRSVAVARTKLDEMTMWMNRAIAMLNPPDPEPNRPNR